MKFCYLLIELSHVQLNNTTCALVSLSRRNTYFNMSKPKVFVTNSAVPKIAFEILSKSFDVIYNDGSSPSREEILSKVQGVDALFWSTKHQLDKEILDRAGCQLRVISTMSVGVDHIDVDEVKKRGILLGNVRDTLNAAVADMAVLLALAAGRRIREGWEQMQNGGWEFSVNWLLGMELRDSTVGIVGLGSIGMEIIKRLRGFDVNQFIYCGHKEKDEGRKIGAKFVSFDELLKTSDFIIVSCPYTCETHEMFNANAFDKMKKTAIFVNIARGKIVDQEALINALENEKIFAAGLDVMTPEPLPVGHKLFTIKNCVLVPHLGSATIRTRKDMAAMAAKNILAVFENKQMPSPL